MLCVTPCISFFLFLFVFGEIGFLCETVLTVLRLVLYTRLASNSLKLECHYLPRTGMKGKWHHTQIAASTSILYRVPDGKNTQEWTTVHRLNLTLIPLKVQPRRTLVQTGAGYLPHKSNSGTE